METIDKMIKNLRLARKLSLLRQMKDCNSSSYDPLEEMMSEYNHVTDNQSYQFV